MNQAVSIYNTKGIGKAKVTYTDIPRTVQRKVEKFSLCVKYGLITAGDVSFPLNQPTGGGGAGSKSK